MKSRLLRISSKDRATTSKSKYDINFITNDNDLHQAYRVELKSAIIPNTQYNITSRDNKIDYKIDGVLSSYTLEPGFYSLNDVVTKLNADVALDFSIVQYVSKLEVTDAAALTDFTIEDSSLLRLLGFDDFTNTTLKGIKIRASNFPNLYGLRHIYIGSNVLSNNLSMVTSEKEKYNVFCDIPVKVQHGQIQTEDNNRDTLDFVDFHFKKNISNIDIKLLDENFTPIDLNGAEWVLLFKVYF